LSGAAAEKHPWVGITRFKEGFGGERKSYIGQYELPVSRLWYRLFGVVKRFR
jgi:lipid II:glycine glycyltransferase (peptidoglycan interpeptide bridge formation enzyme)